MNGYDCTYGTSMQTRHVCLCMHVCMNVCMYAYVISHVCRLLFLEEQTIIKIHFGFGGLTQWLKCLQHKQKDQSSNPQDPCKCQPAIPTWRAETGNPRSKLAGEPSCIGELWVWLRDPVSKDKVD